jgi:hypothetical protein
VLTRPHRFRNQRIEIAADELTAQQSARAVSAAAGRPVGLIAPFPDAPNPLFAWLDRVGDRVDVAAVRASYPQIDWHDFATWARHQDWHLLRQRQFVILWCELGGESALVVGVASVALVASAPV